MPDRLIRILLVEDDPDDALLMKEYLTDANSSSLRYELKHVTRLSEGIKTLSSESFDIILQDLTLPDSVGLETLDSVKKSGCSIPILVLTGLTDESTAMEALRRGAQDYLVKGQIDSSLLSRSIRYAIERHRIAEELHETTVSKDYVDSIINSMVDMLIVVDPQGTIVKVNPSLIHTLGFDESDLVGKKFESLGLELLLDQGESYNAEQKIRTKNGSEIPVLFSSSTLVNQKGETQGLVFMAQDVTERKKLEGMVVQSEKMSSLGQLAAGVAHDFNNLLTSILMNTDFILETLDKEDTRREDAEEIKKAGEGASALCRELLAFGRKQILHPKVVDLNDVVVNIEKILKRTIGENVSLTHALDQSLGQVKADPGQIEQVILNLVINARDAMKKGGNVYIHTGNVDLQEPYLHEQFTIPAGHYVMVTVSDTGCGIPKEVVTRIFEPFFTTKEKGKGTGLGLSTVYGIIQQSGGYIWVYSEIDKGTTFKIFLPRVGEGAATKEASGPTQTETKGSETILLVEDETPVRQAAKRVLGKSGYNVLEAQHGQEALQISQGYQDPIHMILSDVVMPGINGSELVGQLVPIRPEIKVLFMSGYPIEVIGHHGAAKMPVDLIPKPFIPKQLLVKVRQVLDKGKQSKDFDTYDLSKAA